MRVSDEESVEFRVPQGFTPPCCFFVFAGLISIYGSFFLRPSDSFRQSKGTGDEHDDTDFLLDIFICLFVSLQILELGCYLIGFIVIQGRAEIVDEFSEAFRCGCEGMLVSMRVLRSTMRVDVQERPRLCEFRWL